MQASEGFRERKWLLSLPKCKKKKERERETSHRREWFLPTPPGFPGGTVVKNLLPRTGDRRRGSNPWVRKIPWRRKSQPIPVFLPGKFHGQKSPEDYSPWRCNELATAEQLHMHTALPFYYNASTPPLCTHRKHYCYQASFCQENLRFILWRS